MCNECGGELVELGQLGVLLWLRCRNCGMTAAVENGEVQSC